MSKRKYKYENNLLIVPTESFTDQPLHKKNKKQENPVKVTEETPASVITLAAPTIEMSDKQLTVADTELLPADDKNTIYSIKSKSWASIFMESILPKNQLKLNLLAQNNTPNLNHLASNVTCNNRKQMNSHNKVIAKQADETYNFIKNNAHIDVVNDKNVTSNLTPSKVAKPRTTANKHIVNQDGYKNEVPTNSDVIMNMQTQSTNLPNNFFKRISTTLSSGEKRNANERSIPPECKIKCGGNSLSDESSSRGSSVRPQYKTSNNNTIKTNTKYPLTPKDSKIMQKVIKSAAINKTKNNVDNLSLPKTSKLIGDERKKRKTTSCGNYTSPRSRKHKRDKLIPSSSSPKDKHKPDKYIQLSSISKQKAYKSIRYSSPTRDKIDKPQKSPPSRDKHYLDVKKPETPNYKETKTEYSCKSKTSSITSKITKLSKYTTVGNKPEPENVITEKINTLKPTLIRSIVKCPEKEIKHIYNDQSDDIDLRLKLCRKNLHHDSKVRLKYNRRQLGNHHKKTENLRITVHQDPDKNTTEPVPVAAKMDDKKEIKYKKIQLVINVICNNIENESLRKTAHSDKMESSSSESDNDLSFLEDFDVDEIVESLSEGFISLKHSVNMPNTDKNNNRQALNITSPNSNASEVKSGIEDKDTGTVRCPKNITEAEFNSSNQALIQSVPGNAQYKKKEWSDGTVPKKCNMAETTEAIDKLITNYVFEETSKIHSTTNVENKINKSDVNTTCQKTEIENCVLRLVSKDMNISNNKCSTVPVDATVSNKEYSLVHSVSDVKSPLRKQQHEMTNGTDNVILIDDDNDEKNEPSVKTHQGISYVKINPIQKSDNVIIYVDDMDGSTECQTKLDIKKHDDNSVLSMDQVTRSSKSRVLESIKSDFDTSENKRQGSTTNIPYYNREEQRGNKTDNRSKQYPQRNDRENNSKYTTVSTDSVVLYSKNEIENCVLRLVSKGMKISNNKFSTVPVDATVSNKEFSLVHSVSDVKSPLSKQQHEMTYGTDNVNLIDYDNDEKNKCKVKTHQKINYVKINPIQKSDNVIIIVDDDMDGSSESQTKHGIKKHDDKSVLSMDQVTRSSISRVLESIKSDVDTTENKRQGSTTNIPYYNREEQRGNNDNDNRSKQYPQLEDRENNIKYTTVSTDTVVLDTKNIPKTIITHIKTDTKILNVSKLTLENNKSMVHKNVPKIKIKDNTTTEKNDKKVSINTCSALDSKPTCQVGLDDTNKTPNSNKNMEVKCSPNSLTKEANQKGENGKQIMPVVKTADPVQLISNSDNQKEENGKQIMPAVNTEDPVPFISHSDLAIAYKLEERMLELLGMKYTITALINSGKYSKIFKCHDVNGKGYAVKSLKYISTRHVLGVQKKVMLMRLQNEIPKKNLSLVYLINSFSTSGHWCFLMEYYPINLEQAMVEYGKCFYIDLIQHLAIQLVSAVTVLRNSGVVHSDIKPSHILLSSNKTQLKLCGFDASYYVANERLPHEIGSINYRAPEVILGHSASFSIDVWSVGVVLYEMATSIQLFPGYDNNDILFKQMCTVGPAPYDMLQRSALKNSFFCNGFFMRTCGPTIKPIKIIKSSGKLQRTVIGAYKSHWVENLNNKQKNEIAPKINSFLHLLEKVLVIHPKYRLPIEFVSAHPFIHNVYSEGAFFLGLNYKAK